MVSVTTITAPRDSRGKGRRPGRYRRWRRRRRRRSVTPGNRRRRPPAKAAMSRAPASRAATSEGSEPGAPRARPNRRRSDRARIRHDQVRPASDQFQVDESADGAVPSTSASSGRRVSRETACMATAGRLGQHGDSGFEVGGQVTRLVAGTTTWRAKPPGAPRPTRPSGGKAMGPRRNRGTPRRAGAIQHDRGARGTSPPGHSSTTPTTSWPRVAGQ